MTTRREEIFQPCQYCGKSERRALKNAKRVATCFECKMARTRKAAKAQQRAGREKRQIV